MMNVEIRISASVTQRDGYCAINTIARVESVLASEYDLEDVSYGLGVRGKKVLDEARAMVEEYDRNQKKVKTVAA